MQTIVLIYFIMWIITVLYLSLSRKKNIFVLRLAAESWYVFSLYTLITDRIIV